MTADADGGADAGRESEGPACAGDCVVKLANGRTGLHPCGFRLLVDGYRSEVYHVDDHEGRRRGGVGKAFVVVAAALDFYLKAENPGATDCSLDVGHAEWGDDEVGLLRQCGSLPEIL